ncbi:hypothetical protein KCU61_g105, partial [Aureobasidium melanogenum]
MTPSWRFNSTAVATEWRHLAIFDRLLKLVLDVLFPLCSRTTTRCFDFSWSRRCCVVTRPNFFENSEPIQHCELSCVITLPELRQRHPSCQCLLDEGKPRRWCLCSRSVLRGNLHILFTHRSLA